MHSPNPIAGARRETGRRLRKTFLMFGLKPVLGYSLWFTFTTWKGKVFFRTATDDHFLCLPCVPQRRAHLIQFHTRQRSMRCPIEIQLHVSQYRTTYRMLLVASPRCNLNQLDANDPQWLVLAVSFIAEE